MISKIAGQAGGGVGAAAPSGGGFLGAINRSTQGLQDFNQNLAGPSGGGMPSAAENGNIIALGKMLQSKYGLRVDENIHFDGKHPRPGAHSAKGGHYDGTAIDVNAPGSVVEANDPKWGPLFDDIARAGAAAGYHTLWKSPDGKHNNHIHFQYSGSMGRNSKIGAERGGILKGPDSGYPVELHGTEMVVPLNNRFTRSMNKSSEQYTVNGRQVGKKEYDSFMKSHPELQNIQDKVKALLTTVQGNKADPARLMQAASALMDTNLTGIKDEIVDKNKKIQSSLAQMVTSETTKAIKAVNEANGPMQTMANEMSRSMRKVMEAHTQSMNELAYKLTDMIDALTVSNDTTKKILKKASA
jgi:hypothetical protein